MSSPSSLQDFAGLWQVDRVIDDARAGQRITGQGQARFTPGADLAELVYDEDMVLSLPGQSQPLRGTRRYLWAELAGDIEIRFEDGRRLQRISLKTAPVRDVHLCDPDRYDGQYRFGDWPLWQAIWRVTGPRKDYVMTSTYRRNA